MATLSSSRTKFLQLLICCDGRAGISSVAAGLRLATTPKVIATKSKVLLCRARSQVSMPTLHRLQAGFQLACTDGVQVLALEYMSAVCHGVPNLSVEC